MSSFNAWRVIDKQPESAIITSFVLAPVDGISRLDFRPGQFLTLRLRLADNSTLLQIDSLFKQGSVGDVQGDRPGMMDFVGRAKYDAWAGLKGKTQDAAKQAYIDLIESLKK